MTDESIAEMLEWWDSEEPIPYVLTDSPTEPFLTPPLF